MGPRLFDAPVVATLADAMLQRIPRGYPADSLGLMHASLGLIQIGGEAWPQWRDPVFSLLIEAQVRNEGCRTGSWDPQGLDVPGHELGRGLSTTVATPTLQTGYRYGRIVDLAKVEPPPPATPYLGATAPADEQRPITPQKHTPAAPTHQPAQDF